MEFQDNAAGLKALKYRDIQKVAMKVGVKGTLSKVQLIQKILEKKPTKVSKAMATGKLNLHTFH